MTEARNVGLLRLSKCKWAPVKRDDQRANGPKPEHRELAAMSRVPDAESMLVLGAPGKIQADSTLEIAHVVARAWSALHAKVPVLRSRGHLNAKLRVLHLGIFPCFAWASGTRHWCASELQKLKA